MCIEIDMIYILKIYRYELVNKNIDIQIRTLWLYTHVCLVLINLLETMKVIYNYILILNW